MFSVIWTRLEVHILMKFFFNLVLSDSVLLLSSLKHKIKLKLYYYVITRYEVTYHTVHSTIFISLLLFTLNEDELFCCIYNILIEVRITTMLRQWIP